MKTEITILLNKISRRIKILEKRRDKINQEIYLLREELMDKCPHEIQETLQEYFEGGYLNTGHIDYRNVCTTCNKVIREWSKDTGRYA